ncbi:MAG: hypothetical protein IT201_03290 [Thermoleophilia bacterium]|nr:hypothetical protein [Thermoleophilia bacterium]
MAPEIADGFVTTVRGPLHAGAIGLTSMHEHVLCDLGVYRDVYRDDPADALPWALPFELGTRGLVEQHGPYRSQDNCRLDDEDVMAGELERFARGGGATVLELSCSGIRGDPLGLRRLSERTGVNIVASTGLYIEESWPEELRAADVDRLTEHMIGEVERGIGDTDVRAGHIGEIGLTTLSAKQERVLAAAAQAAVATGLSVTVHPGFEPGTDGRRAVALLERHGLDPARVVVAHGDAFLVEHGLRDLVLDPGRRSLRLGYHEELLSRGANISIDCFGHRWNLLDRDWLIESDADRLAGVVALVRRGYAAQLVLGTDVCFRMLTRAGGGLGYAWLTEFVLPTLRRVGISDGDIRRMTIESPARLLVRRG